MSLFCCRYFTSTHLVFGLLSDTMSQRSRAAHLQIKTEVQNIFWLLNTLPAGGKAGAGGRCLMFFLPELLLIITVDIFDVLKTNVKQN